MVRPISRSNPGINDNESLTDAASYSLDDLNCGLKCCGFSFCWSWKKYASLKKFVIVLCLLGLLEGAVSGYFSAHSHSNSAHIAPAIIKYLSVSSGLTQGVLAIFLAYWGGSRHRPKIIRLFTVLIAISCISIAVFLFTKNEQDPRQDKMDKTFLQTDVPVCVRNSDREASRISWNWCPYTISGYFFLQFAIGVANIAFMALGITFVDDNSEIEKSPQFMGMVLAAKYFGPQIGYAFSYLPLDNLQITGSVWSGLGVAILLIIFILGLFPGRLNSQLVKPDSINSVEFNRGLRPYRRSYYPRQKTGCLASIKRVLSIKMVIFNTLAVICVQTVIINFTLMRETYLGSVFMISKYSGTVQSRLLIDILQPPLVALAIILTGLFLRHIKPRASRLAIWNIFVVCFVSGLMFTAVLLKCENPFTHDQAVKSANDYKSFDDYARYSSYSNSLGGYSSNLPGARRYGRYDMTRLDLSSVCKDCQCPIELKFSPVCSSDGAVYYSPCHAGCRTFEKSTLVYGNCTCMVSPAISNTVSNPDCYKDGCGERAVLYQILNTVAMALLASTFVINMLFCFRCVQTRDKPTLVGLEMTLVALVAYIPGKFLYLSIDIWTCLLWHSEECKLHDSLSYGTFLNLLSICFLMAAAGFYCCVYFLVKNLKLYGDKPPAEGTQEFQNEAEPLQFTNSNNHIPGNRKLEPGQFSRNFRNSSCNYQKPLMINVGRDRIVRDPSNGSAQYPEMEREPLCWTARSTPTPTSEDLELNFNLQTPTGKMFPLVEFPEPRRSRDFDRPKTPSEFSQPRSPTEISRPKTPIELFRSKTPIELSRPKTPIELSRPKTPIELSRPKTPIELSRPKTPIELSRPKTPNGVSRSRTPSLSSEPRSPNGARPKTLSPTPLSNSEVELNFNLQTPPGARSPGTTFRTDGVLTTLL